MKARKIFKGAMAGLMSISLLMSGLPVTAAEVNNTNPGQQTETGDTAEGEITSEQQQTAPEENEGTENQPSETPGETNQPQEEPGAENNDTSSSDDANQPQEEPGAENNDTSSSDDANQPQEEPGAENSDTSNSDGTNQSQEEPGTESNDTSNSDDANQPQEEPGTESNDTSNSDDANQPQEEPGTENSDTSNSDGTNQSQEEPEEENNDIEDEQDSEKDDDKKDSEKDDDKKDSKKDDDKKDSKKDDDKKDSKKDDDKKDSEKDDDKEEDIAAFSLDGAQVVNGNITVDGDLSDWEEVTARAASGLADSWKVAFSPDGTMLYFCYTGTASTEWDYKFAGADNKFQIEYGDGTNDQSTGIFVAAWDGNKVKNASSGDISGASSALISEAHGNNAGPYRVEFAVPTSFFHNMDFKLTFGGTTISPTEIQQVNGNAVVKDEPAPVYTGISIDGNYADWAAVSKTEASCPNDAHKECLSQVAAVYDGDWFYIYIRDGKSSNASGAGTHSNGKFAITSDLGYETDIQLSTAPEVKGVEGAQVAYVGAEWEIAIPKSQLPKYEKSLSFGLYLAEPFIGGIVNMQPDSENNLENLFNGIIYDGNYEDWEDYGHTTIEYATAGSQESQVDAKGALYSDGAKIYAHVVTNMPQHLQEAGGEFTSAVTVAFNQSADSLKNGSYDQKMAFYPRYVAVDGSGNINWDPQLSGLPEGTYEFYIASRDAWHTSGNINNVNDMDKMYGKMMMTVGKDGKDEMEFYLDVPMVAEKLGVDATDLKEVSAQFGRIGQQWIFTAGTSTGPIVGIIICIASVGIVLWYRKRKKNELIPAAV